MMRHSVLWTVVGFWVMGAGCAARNGCPNACEDQLPKELKKVNLPDYVIEPPDILLIDALRVIPKPPYKIAPFDALLIKAEGVKVEEPIANIFVVDPDGMVQLGLSYGGVYVNGMTLVEARNAITDHLFKTGLREKPEVSVSLAQSRGMQQIRGEHLVRPNGTISLGTYGSIYLAGMTLDEAKEAIEQHLDRWLSKPEITVDVAGYNSKVYYVIVDVAATGLQIVRLPITGNETVLDAISQIYGIPPFASKHHIWVARPAPCEAGYDQILPVDWLAITKGGSTKTNYQVLPGDRIYVHADPLIVFDNYLAKIISPMERLFGVALLGNTTVQAFHGGVGGGGSSPFGTTNTNTVNVVAPPR
jgi:polysaccharide export outer membrane protein